MRKFKIIAERVVIEEAEVTAENEQQAFELAAQLENHRWEPAYDASWQITAAVEVTETIEE